MTSAVNELTADAGGCWLVTTETARYIVDLDQQTIVRHPTAGVRPVDPGDPVSVASLRRDNESIPLVELVRCLIGDSMLLMLDVRRDGVLTCRMTTFVRSICRLGPVGPRVAEAAG